MKRIGQWSLNLKGNETRNIAFKNKGMIKEKYWEEPSLHKFAPPTLTINVFMLISEISSFLLIHRMEFFIVLCSIQWHISYIY